MGKEMKTYALVGLAGLLMWAAGCSSIKRIDARTFLQHGEDSTRMGSATSYDVIGISHDRAYIQYDTVVTLSGRPATHVYWIPLSELPTNIVTDLKAGMNPWPQWWKTHEKMNANIAARGDPHGIAVASAETNAPFSWIASSNDLVDLADKGEYTRTFSATSSVARQLTRQIDQVCSWVGAQRLGPLLSCDGTCFGESSEYWGYVMLNSRGRPEKYRVGMDDQNRVFDFLPCKWKLQVLENQDATQPAAVRSRLLDLIAKLNSHLGLRYADLMGILKLKEGYCVRFALYTREEVKAMERRGERVGWDPFVNFIVTEDFVVFGWFRGA